MSDTPRSDDPDGTPREDRELEWADGWHEGDPFDPTERHPLLKRAEKIFSGMDEIRSKYPTPEARAAARIDEAGWQEMERIVANLRAAYPAAVAADDECIRMAKAKEASKAEQEAARARALEALGLTGPRLN